MGGVSLGRLKSLARIFVSIACMKINGFARILPVFLPKNCYLKNSRGAAAPLSSMGRMPMILIVGVRNLKGILIDFNLKVK